MKNFENYVEYTYTIFLFEFRFALQIILRLVFELTCNVWRAKQNIHVVCKNKKKTETNK